MFGSPSSNSGGCWKFELDGKGGFCCNGGDCGGGCGCCWGWLNGGGICGTGGGCGGILVVATLDATFGFPGVFGLLGSIFEFVVSFLSDR